jgi:hypothetical protein
VSWSRLPPVDMFLHLAFVAPQTSTTSPASPASPFFSFVSGDLSHVRYAAAARARFDGRLVKQPWPRAQKVAGTSPISGEPAARLRVHSRSDNRAILLQAWEAESMMVSVFCKLPWDGMLSLEAALPPSHLGSQRSTHLTSQHLHHANRSHDHRR